VGGWTGEAGEGREVGRRSQECKKSEGNGGEGRGTGRGMGESVKRGCCEETKEVDVGRGRGRIMQWGSVGEAETGKG